MSPRLEPDRSRTRGLLHGKQTSAARLIRLLPANERFHAYAASGASSYFVTFAAVVSTNRQRADREQATIRSRSGSRRLDPPTTPMRPTGVSPVGARQSGQQSWIGGGGAVSRCMENKSGERHAGAPAAHPGRHAPARRTQLVPAVWLSWLPDRRLEGPQPPAPRSAQPRHGTPRPRSRPALSPSAPDRHTSRLTR